MTENYLIDLMGELDTKFLENEYPERDIQMQKAIAKRKRTLRPFKKGNVFVISDTLYRTINEQRELYDNIVAHEPVSELAAHAKEQVKQKVDAVQAKIKALVAVVSGVVAMLVVIISLVRMENKKKWLNKLFGKSVQTA
jgi:predicted RNA-binding protein